MKILIICSKKFYNKIPEIKEKLESYGHEIHLPNCFDKPESEDIARKQGYEEHSKFKSTMMKHSESVISTLDAVLVLNFDKETQEGMQKNYIGGATFLEMYTAFRLDKKIYMFNDIPEGILTDEIIGFAPIIIHGNLETLRGI